MKKILMALLMALPFTVMAQQKVAVVNTSQVMESMSEVKAAQTKVEDLKKKYEADIKGMQDELTKKFEAFQKESESLPEAVRTRRGQEIQELQTRLQNSSQFMGEDLQKQFAQLMAPIQQKVRDAIKKVSDADGCTYVFEAEAALYVGKDAIDITDKVKAEVGANAPAKPKTNKK